MKKNILFSVLIAALFIAGCSKNDGMIPEHVTTELVPQPEIFKSHTGGTANIDLTNLAAFDGRFVVRLLYANTRMPEKIDVIIRKNNNNATAKVLYAGVTTLPSELTLTAAQITTLFGPIALGDNYDLAMDIYAGGKKYEAFPAVGASYGNTGSGNQPEFQVVIRYSAVCAYNPALFPTGNYVVLEDGWQDYFPGDIVTLTQIDATHISFVYLTTPASTQPIVITINPVTNATTAATVNYGNYGGINWVASLIANHPDNVVLPCAKEISIRLQHTTTSGGNGGAYTIRFRKI